MIEITLCRSALPLSVRDLADGFDRLYHYVCEGGKDTLLSDDGAVLLEIESVGEASLSIKTSHDKAAFIEKMQRLPVEQYNKLAFALKGTDLELPLVPLSRLLADARFEMVVGGGTNASHFRDERLGLFAKSSAYNLGTSKYAEISKPGYDGIRITDEDLTDVIYLLKRQYYSNELLNLILNSGAAVDTDERYTAESRLIAVSERVPGAKGTHVLVSRQTFVDVATPASMDGLTVKQKKLVQLAQLLGFVDIKPEHIINDKYSDDFYFIDLLLLPGGLEYECLTELGPGEINALLAILATIKPEKILRPEGITEDAHNTMIELLKAIMAAHLTLLELKVKETVSIVEIDKALGELKIKYTEMESIHVAPFVGSLINPDYRVKPKKLLVCYALSGVNGEISMILSQAESWIKQGKKDFDLEIYFNAEDCSSVRRQIKIFESRYEALAKKGIKVTLFSSPGGGIIAQYNPDDETRKYIRYTRALVYPVPKILDENLERCQRSLANVHGKYFAETVVFASDTGNLIPNSSWVEAKGLKSLKGEQYEHLKLLQPPSHADVSHISKPDFIGDKPYYLIYVNPELVPTDRRSLDGTGPDYKDAFLLFTKHSIIKHPGENIRIYYNGQKTASRHDLGRIADEIRKCYSEVGRVIYQVYDNDSKAYVSKTIQATDLGRDGGITIEIKSYPSLPHGQFLGLMKHAECLVANASGCLDEAFAMRKPCLIYDNYLMTRIPNLLKIIEKEQCGRPARYLKIIEAFLKAHRDLSRARQAGDELEAAGSRERLLAFFTDGALVRLLEDQFGQLTDLISSKYQLSPALYEVLESLTPPAVEDKAETAVAGGAAASSGAITTESVTDVKEALRAMIEGKMSGSHGAAFFASSAGHTRRDGQHLLNYLNGKEEKITKDEIPEWLREPMEQFARANGFKDSSCLLEVLKPEAPSQAATPG